MVASNGTAQAERSLISAATFLASKGARGGTGDVYLLGTRVSGDRTGRRRGERGRSGKPAVWETQREGIRRERVAGRRGEQLWRGVRSDASCLVPI